MLTRTPESIQNLRCHRVPGLKEDDKTTRGGSGLVGTRRLAPEILLGVDSVGGVSGVHVPDRGGNVFFSHYSEVSRDSGSVPVRPRS